MLNSGSFLVFGQVPKLGYTSDVLLIGSLTALGFGDDDTLEFLFDVQSGDAAELYGSTGAFILRNSGYNGDSFNSDFAIEAAGEADIGVVVPEPASASLLVMGMLVLSAAARRNTVGREGSSR